MAIADLLRRINLGNEFDVGGLVPNRVKLKIGAGLARNVDGTIFATAAAPTVTKLPLYEYREIWAEESGGLTNNSSEWSYGNGATGFMGLVVDEGWEAVAMYFHADTYAATTSIQVDLMSYVTASNAAANTIASISLANASDGGGTTDNAFKYETFGTPAPVPAGPIGFLTRSLVGTASDGRVGARLRRQIGEYVSEVTA